MKKVTIEAFTPTEIKVEQLGNNEARISVWPFESGYGVTLAHPLRRLLYSSTVGFAPTGVKIEGVEHEFDSMRGMLEDVTIFIVNLKNLRYKLKNNAKREVVHYEFEGPLEISGKDLNNDLVEIVNPDAYLATINEDAKLSFDLIIEKGIGYVPSENIKEEIESGFIALDAFFTPVKKAVYDIQNVLVEDNPDYEKIVMTVTTDGQISPLEAFQSSVSAMYKQLGIFDKILEVYSSSSISASTNKGEHAKLFESVDNLNLSVRSLNCLKKSGIELIGELALMSEPELKEIKNLGKRSLDEMKDVMKAIGYAFDGSFEGNKEAIRKKIVEFKKGK